MRAIVALYLVIGVVLLAIGFLLPGPCPNRNTDVVNNLVLALLSRTDFLEDTGRLPFFRAHPPTLAEVRTVPEQRRRPDLIKPQTRSA